MIDFRERSHEFHVVSGFWAWERMFRWMSAEGVLRLTPVVGAPLLIRAHVPLSLLRRRWPDLKGVRAIVNVNGFRAGEVYIDREGVQDFRVAVPPNCFRPGEEALVGLKCDVTWRPREVDPQNMDERLLSIAVTAVEFRDPSHLAVSYKECGRNSL